MNESDKLHRMKYANCPICNSIGKFEYLSLMGNDEFRIYKCVDNDTHVFMFSHEILYNDKS